MGDYAEFLERKKQLGGDHGFDPIWMPDFLFDFQRVLVEWALKKGRSAIFADCGMGKTPMQLVWAENVVRKTNGRVLLLTPLAVAAQTIKESEKFGIRATHSRDGKLGKAGIYISNYERLHYFQPDDFVGIICDESSILKHFGGATQKALTRFTAKMPNRLLCTATAAPNDYIELGTSSEVLGALGYSDMLSRFFAQQDNKKHRMNDVKLARGAKTGNHYARLAYRVSQTIGQYRMKGHAEEAFWRWVCSWARACRMPSDLGFDNKDFILPELIQNDHIVHPAIPAEGMLFEVDAFGLQEERQERRRTVDERCRKAAELVSHKRPAVIWCHYNYEGDALAKLIPDAVQISGATPEDERERAYAGFSDGSIRVIVTKPKIGAWGLNWQHCNHVITFASHSYEQFYQAVRRCWRFGQTRPVTVDVISTKGERHIRDNMERKKQAADIMFTRLVENMNDSLHIERQEDYDKPVEVPKWLIA